MPFASLFSNVAARLFGSTAPGDIAAAEPELVKTAIEAIVDAVDPRLRTVSGYQRRIGPGVGCTIAHLRSMAANLPEPIMIARGAWGSDALLNALFATANDVPALLGASAELRSYFERTSADDACVLLGMQKTERSVFAPAIVDGVLRQDIAQTTVSFSKHRLVAPAANFIDCRREVGTLILRRLAELALARITALAERATGLEQRKGMLAAKLRMLNLRRNGLGEMANGAGDVAGEIAAIERELKSTVDEYVETKTSQATLNTRIDHINAIFTSPAEHVSLEHVALRVNKMGYKVEANASEPAADLTLHELSIGNGFKAVIAFVRCRREELPPRESLLVRAAREGL